MPSRRAARRLVRHHGPLALGSGLATAALVAHFADRPQVVWRWSMATAYVGLALLAFTLLPGALARLRGERYPASTDLRRDAGIWAGLFAVAHFVVGWQVHMKRRWMYFLPDHHGAPVLRPRLDLFGFANYTGLLAVLIAALLLALSNDRSLRALGRARWKRLQSWNVWLFGLVALHAAAYQYAEKRSLGWVLLAAAAFVATAAVRVAARMRGGSRTVDAAGDMADAA